MWWFRNKAAAIKGLIGVGAFALTAVAATATGGAGLVLVGAAIGAWQYGSNSLIDQNYSMNSADMQVHVDGKAPGKSQFLYDVDADKAVLDAAAYADANDLWFSSSGNPSDFTNKAKVSVTNGPVGVTGGGELTDIINVYRTKTGYVHGSPGNP